MSGADSGSGVCLFSLILLLASREASVLYM